MRAMVLEGPQRPLVERQLPQRSPADHQLLVQVKACGVCRTDLHVVDGELRNPKLPLIVGHEVIGSVVESGRAAGDYAVGQLVGIPWLGWTCGECRFCRSGRENLCERAQFTGYTLDGGYAEQAVADARFCFPVDATLEAVHVAPMMCAGLIGYRALRACGDARTLGLYGFGAAAHIVTQLAVFEGRRVFAFTRAGDRAGQQFALELGAQWAGGSDAPPPEPLDAAIIFAPVGALVPLALDAVDKGGVVVCAGIHMSDIPTFAYERLWHERVLRSVANLTRKDGEGFFALAKAARVKTTVESYPLAKANEALDALRSGRVQGAAVLIP